MRLRLNDPTITADQIAALLHVSPRTVWRYWHASGRFSHRGRLTDTDRQAIVAAYAAGESVAQIAARYRMHDSTVHKALRAAHVELDQTRGAKGIDTGQVVARRRAGQSVRQIAAALGVWPSVVDYHLAKAGEVQPPPHTSYPHTRDRVLALARAEPGLTQDQIAARLGVSRSTVAGHLRRARRQGLLPDAEARGKRGRALGRWLDRLGRCGRGCGRGSSGCAGRGV
ncbi:helix-turn-helix domain-containing protein [Actinomadura kijaniata]|uniref:helix-turn-helix domain-containing protein n=1 Tax=Actinomadura kijaniata TaxID=46161 RepID=UPI003F1E30D0